MAGIEELWSAQDEARLKAFVEAASHDDLPGALHALEGASAQARARDALQLQAWGHEVAANAGDEPMDELRALASVLGEEAGFRGDTKDYLDPANSHLHQVIERRRGLPILLSVVWTEVAARLGVQAYALGLPGRVHVLVGEPEDRHVVVDPWEG